MIALVFLAFTVSLNFCIAQEAASLHRPELRKRIYTDPSIMNDNIWDETLKATNNEPEYYNQAPAFSKVPDNSKTPKMGKRDMLKEMYDLLRSPDLDYITIVKRFIQIYQPQYKTEVLNFLQMMGRYSIPQFNHPIFQRQRRILPILTDLVVQTDIRIRK